MCLGLCDDFGRLHMLGSLLSLQCFEHLEFDSLYQLEVAHCILSVASELPVENYVHAEPYLHKNSGASSRNESFDQE